MLILNNRNSLAPSTTKNLNIPILILQCIGILAVVIGHANIGHGSIPVWVASAFPYYSWHMPFFIFLSGYLFNRKLPVKLYILRKCRTLLFPALGVNAIHGIFSMTLNQLNLTNYGRNITLRRLFVTPFTTGYQFYINVSLWFIFCLFTIEVFACLLDRISKGNCDLCFVVISLAVSLYCCACAFFDHNNTRQESLNAFLRFGFLFFFFWFGAFYHRYLECYIKPYFNLKSSILIFIIQSLLLGLCPNTITYNTRNFNLSSITIPNGFWIPVVAPLVAIVFWLGIAYSLEPHLRDCKSIHWLGTNTRYVVYYHQLCFILFSFLMFVLQNLNVIPSIPGFSLEALQNSQYYVSSNINIASINIICSIIMPITVCTSIKKIKSNVLALGVSSFIIASIVAFLFLVKALI